MRRRFTARAARLTWTKSIGGCAFVGLTFLSPFSGVEGTPSRGNLAGATFTSFFCFPPRCYCRCRLLSLFSFFNYACCDGWVARWQCGAAQRSQPGQPGVWVLRQPARFLSSISHQHVWNLNQCPHHSEWRVCSGRVRTLHGRRGVSSGLGPDRHTVLLIPLYA